MIQNGIDPSHNQLNMGWQQLRATATITTQPPQMADTRKLDRHFTDAFDELAVLNIFVENWWEFYGISDE